MIYGFCMLLIARHLIISQRLYVYLGGEALDQFILVPLATTTSLVPRPHTPSTEGKGIIDVIQFCWAKLLKCSAPTYCTLFHMDKSNPPFILYIVSHG